MRKLWRILLYPITATISTIKVLLKVVRYGIFAVGVTAIGLSFHVYQLTHLERVEVATAPVPYEVADMYTKLRMATDQVGKIPPIYMLHTVPSMFIPNAYVDEYGIYLTYALVNQLQDNPDALALIIGHEIAHSLMHHTHGMNILVRDSSAADELMSDGYGAFLAAKAGYNVCKGAEFFLSMRSIYGDNLSTTHPPHIVRYNHLQMAYCTVDK